MAKLITGRFEDADDVKRGLEGMIEAGFAKHEYGTFYVGPPGQHDIEPLGGDAYSDGGAEDSGAGAATGAALGGAAGLAAGVVAAVALPVVGIGIGAALAATGVGAYVGSLMGAMSQTEHADPKDSTREQPIEESGGVRMAVNVDRPGTEAQAIAILQNAGAVDISHAVGEWRDREWKDFDPRVALKDV